MSSLTADLFVEDSAHEEFVKYMLSRIAQGEGVNLSIQIRSARGGHPVVLDEFRNYQKAVLRGVAGMVVPDLLVIAIDANCNSFAKAHVEVEGAIEPKLRGAAVVACPDPHVERWYLADPDSFLGVVGVRPQPGKKKCERDVYKAMLSKAISRAGHPPTLGGIEFAREIVEAMDLYRAGKSESSLKHFVEDAKALLRRLKGSQG